MSTTHDEGIKLLSEAISRHTLKRAIKTSSSQPLQSSSDQGETYEEQITKIAKDINDTGMGHREAMYRGAAECAAMARRIEQAIDMADQLFDGRLKQHWLKKKQNASEIYRFLIQSAFSDSKQASKVFTATRAMFESKSSASEFVRRLRKYGFEGLRKKDAATDSKKEVNEPSGTATSDEQNAKEPTTIDTLSNKLKAANIDPRHPTITAIYSRMYRSKVEHLLPDDKLRIKAVVWESRDNGPIIRITSMEKTFNKRTSRKSG